MKADNDSRGAHAASCLECHVEQGKQMTADAHPGTLAALHAAEAQASCSGDLPSDYLMAALAIAMNRERVSFLRVGMRTRKAVPYTPPRYDDVFAAGVAAMGDEVGSTPAENLAIIAVVGGVVCPLYHRADDSITEHIQATDGVCAFTNGAHDPLPDGVYVVSLSLGDGFIDLASPRSPTTAEWLAYVGDGHAWSVP